MPDEIPLRSPFPFAAMLPAIYQSDTMMLGMLTALDEVLAPVINTLDCFSAYLDPATAPDDYVLWLGEWMGLVPLELLPPDRRRETLRAAPEYFATRGTRAALELAIATCGFGDVIVDDSGGTAWSQTPGGTLPGEATCHVSVQASAPAQLPKPAAERLLHAILRDAVPGHISSEHQLEDAG